MKIGMTSCLLTVFAGVLCAQTPPTITIVTNYLRVFPQARLSPGSQAYVLGDNFGPTRGPADPTPTVGLTVLINEAPAEIWYSPNNSQLGIRLPLDAKLGPGSLVVVYKGVRSAPFAIQIDRLAPFILDLADISLVGVSDPIAQMIGSPGDLIEIRTSGLGPTNPPAPLGSEFFTCPNPPFRLVCGPPTVATPQLTVGGRSLPVLSSTYSAHGNEYVVFRLPSDFRTGFYPTVVSVEGLSSQSVLFEVAIRGIVPTQSGFTFQGTQGGGAPSGNRFQILNGVLQSLRLDLTATTLSGGSWLTVSPTTATTTPGTTTAPVTVSVNPAGLPPGDYYGQIRVNAPGAPNSPQIVSTVLNVGGANSNPGPSIDPTGVVFVAVAGGAAPAAVPIKITNVTSRPTTFTATASVPSGTPWFTVTPTSGTVTPGQPVTIQVAPTAASRALGVYPGTLSLQFPSDNVTRFVDMALVVTPVAPVASRDSAAAPEAAEPLAAGCFPAKLIPVFTLLGNAFTASVAWPSALEVQVVDDCGTPLTSGSVIASFSNGDVPLRLIPSSGRWTATWVPVHPVTAGVKVHVDATQDTPKLTGSADLTGGVPANPNVPVLNAGGVVSAASYSDKALPAPGEIVSIFGTNLADALGQSSGLPLSTSLQGATLSIAGVALPLVFVSENQVNAVLPYSIKSGATQQLIAQRGSRLSAPIPIQVADAEPAVFTTDLSGKGQGHIYVVDSSGGQFLADAGHPAHAKDVLVIYTSGLGAVNPSAIAGSATPFDALRRVTNDISLTIDGVPAAIAFAGLTPGFTGLYQINAVVPDGVKAGKVPVVITVGGIDSPPVTMAVAP